MMSDQNPFDTLDPADDPLSDEVETALRQQDEALTLLERLRQSEPFAQKNKNTGGGRRDFRRWATPSGVLVQMHDGKRWCTINCSDIAVGGSRTDHLPVWGFAPRPVRLQAPTMTGGVLVLSDVMWKGDKPGQAGLRWEFGSDDERDYWAEALIDALLAQHALT